MKLKNLKKNLRKTSREYLEKAFPIEYIANGLNGTKAYKAIKKNANDNTARREASRLLTTNPHIQKSIIDLLPKDDEEASIIREAFNTQRPDKISWKDLRGYLETSLKLKGYLQNNGNNTQVNIGLKLE